MKIFIDFDDVLFNTKQFKEDLAGVFLGHGISKDLYNKTYYDDNTQDAIKTYNPMAQISRLTKETNINREKLLSSIESFLQNASKYVFSDVANFAKNFQAENIYIISYGEITFQAKKIEISGIKRYIPNVLITGKLKAEILGEFLGNENLQENEAIFFLDDRVEQIHDVKNKFPEIVSVLVKRPEGRYQEMKKEECCNFEAHNLKEAEKIINSFN